MRKRTQNRMVFKEPTIEAFSGMMKTPRGALLFLGRKADFCAPLSLITVRLPDNRDCESISNRHDYDVEAALAAHPACLLSNEERRLFRVATNERTNGCDRHGGVEGQEGVVPRKSLPPAYLIMPIISTGGANRGLHSQMPGRSSSNATVARINPSGGGRKRGGGGRGLRLDGDRGICGRLRRRSLSATCEEAADRKSASETSG